jgi:hypothetical protein
MKYLALLAAVFLAILGYVGFWFYTASQMEAALWAWRDAPPPEIQSAEFASISVEGFPFRIKPVLSEVDITFKGQNGNWQWRKKMVSFVMQPWNLRHAIADISGPHQLRDPNDHIHKLTIVDGLASLLIDKNGRLQDLNIDSKDLSAKIGGLNAAATIDRFSFFARQNQQPEGGHDIALRVMGTKLNPHPDLPAWLQTFQLLDVDMTVAHPIALPLTKPSLQKWRDTGGNVTFRKGHLKSTEVQIDAAGSLTLDSELRPAGRLNTEIRGYGPIIDDLVRRQKINHDIASNAKVALNFMAAAWGGKAVAPILLKDGLATLGPLQLVQLQPVIN